MNTDLKPQPKVATGGLAASLAVILIYAAGQFGVELPAEVAAAISTLVYFMAAYIKPNN